MNVNVPYIYTFKGKADFQINAGAFAKVELYNLLRSESRIVPFHWGRKTDDDRGEFFE